LNIALGRRGSTELLEALREAAKFGLDFELIADYGAVPIPNAKLRSFLARLEKDGAFETLWLTPSLPYYRLGSPFDAVSGGLTCASSRAIDRRTPCSAWKRC
jgi:hypothetical protein